MNPEYLPRKRAFTGGSFRGGLGRLSWAEGGTIFLDEVGDLPMEDANRIVARFADAVFERVGGTKFCALTSRNHHAESYLDRRLSRTAPSHDLYYRLNVFPIKLPPLSRTER